MIAPAGHHCDVRSGHLNATFGGKDMGSMAQTGLLLVPSDTLGHTWAFPGALGGGKGLPPPTGPRHLLMPLPATHCTEYTEKQKFARRGTAAGPGALTIVKTQFFPPSLDTTHHLDRAHICSYGGHCCGWPICGWSFEISANCRMMTTWRDERAGWVVGAVAARARRGAPCGSARCS